MSMPELTIRDVKVRSVVVPMAHPLVTRVITIEQLALLLIDLRTEEGITGRAYLFGFSERGNSYLAPLVPDLAETCRGDKVVPIDLYTKMQKSLTLFGHEGLTLMVLSGIDMACWDALGQAAEVPVASLLGGGTGPIPAYNSNGMGLTDDLGVLADEARRLIAEGDFRAIKVRLGRDTLAEDISAFRAVRGAVGDEILLPVDFNQGLDVAEALKRGPALDEEDVYWIGEPIVYDNLTGCAELAAALNTPIQIGENFWAPRRSRRPLKPRRWPMPCLSWNASAGLPAGYAPPPSPMRPPSLYHRTFFRKPRSMSWQRRQRRIGWNMSTGQRRFSRIRLLPETAMSVCQTGRDLGLIGMKTRWRGIRSRCNRQANCTRLNRN